MLRLPLRLDAALHDPAPPRLPGTNGPPRTKGNRLVNLSDMLADPATVWQRVIVPAKRRSRLRRAGMAAASAWLRSAPRRKPPVSPTLPFGATAECRSSQRQTRRVPRIRWGHLVNELIYEALDPDVAKHLRDNKPKPFHGQNYHQWLSEDVGLKALIPHIYKIIGMAEGCSDMRELRDKVAKRYGRKLVQLTLSLPQKKGA